MLTDVKNHKIRLMMVVESFATGVYSVVKDIVCGLPCEDFEILVVHSLRPDSPENYRQDFDKPNIKLVCVKMDSPVNALKSVFAIKKIIAEWKPDIIHLHSSKAGFIGRLAARFGKVKKVFYSPHGFSFLRRDVSAFSRFIFFTLEKAASIIGGGTVIAVSDGELQHALRVTPNAVRINNFIHCLPCCDRTDEERPLIATIGRIMPQKNPHFFNRLANSMPSYRFLWIGDGEHRAALTAPNIAVTGYLTRAKVLEMLPEITVYVQPSLWEGMPVSILEAMAAARAVAASDIIGNRDIIRSGDTGFLCDIDNPQSFIDTINMLVSDRAKRERIGLSARAFVLENHSLDAAITQYVRTYKGCGQDIACKS